MPVARRAQAQRFEHQQLARCVRQVILAAQQMRDLHQGIIDRVGEEECRRAVLAPHHEIAQMHAIDLLGAMHQILELELSAGRNAKAQRGRRARGQACPARAGVEQRTGTGVTRRAARRQLRAAAELELRTAAEARIGPLLRFEPRQERRVDPTPLRLAVGAAGSAATRALVPLETKPAQVVLEARHMRLGSSRGVRILDAQQESPAQPPRQQQVEQRRAHVAQVQLARGARGKTGYDGGGVHLYNGTVPGGRRARSAWNMHGSVLERPCTVSTLFVSDLHLDAALPAAIDAVRGLPAGAGARRRGALHPRRPVRELGGRRR